MIFGKKRADSRKKTYLYLHNETLLTMKPPAIHEMTAYDPTRHTAICRLLQQLTTAPVTLDEAALRTLLDHPTSHLYLLEEEGQVVGMLTLGIYPAPTGTKGWIEDVVVMEGQRGRGYGRQLVAHAIEAARQEGVRHLMLTSNPQRTAANRLYQTMGFEQRETNCYRMNL